MAFLWDRSFWPFGPFWTSRPFWWFKLFWQFKLFWPLWPFWPFGCSDHLDFFDHLIFFWTNGPLANYYLRFVVIENVLTTIFTSYWHQKFSSSDVVNSTCLYGCSYIDSWQGQGVCLALQHALRKIGYLGDF